MVSVCAERDPCPNVRPSAVSAGPCAACAMVCVQRAAYDASAEGSERVVESGSASVSRFAYMWIAVLGCMATNRVEQVVLLSFFVLQSTFYIAHRFRRRRPAACGFGHASAPGGALEMFIRFSPLRRTQNAPVSPEFCTRARPDERAVSTRLAQRNLCDAERAPAPGERWSQPRGRSGQKIWWQTGH